MEDWIIGVLFALFIIIPCWLALARRKETEKQVNAWPELALRTGLTYTKKPQKWWDPAVNPPSISGDYRGRYLTMYLFNYGNPDRIDTLIYQNTSILLDVQNCAQLSLFIVGKDAGNTHMILDIPSGNRDFDRCFSVTGSPREYVQGAVDLIVQSDPHLFAWIMRYFPSIELKGERLICEQNGELTSIDDQVALLNLLCDLAELAERKTYESDWFTERKI
jgi:hypothetical protein